MAEPEFPSEFLSVMARMGARPDLADASKGHVNVNENLTSHGIIRIAPLMLLADTVVGMRLESFVEDWTFTTPFPPPKEISTHNALSLSLSLCRRG